MIDNTASGKTGVSGLASGVPRVYGSRNPLLYEVNTRVLLRQLESASKRRANLDDIPNSDLDRLAELGFDWVWMLGVWQTGAMGREISRKNAESRHEFEDALPGYTEADICGSCFAVSDYQVNRDFGGNSALRRLRSRLKDRGLRLVLDFVPNHTAIDHPWAWARPELYVLGSDAALREAPGNYIRLQTARGSMVLAHGRDPNYPAWQDTLQLNYSEDKLQEAMKEQLLEIAEMCDGVRCDMAMLQLPAVFERTWGKRPKPFWAEAIQSVRKAHPGFVFIAEAYWDLEWTLMQQGFDYAYDKRLYDRLRDRRARPVRDHLQAGPDYQSKLVRFLENHDEPRAATAFPPPVLEAAAVIVYCVPGLRLFHQGQFDGRRTRVSMHLSRARDEPVDSRVRAFYGKLLAVLQLEAPRNGSWQLLECREAWEGNPTWDGFMCFAWRSANRQTILAAVNYAPDRGQCYVAIPMRELAGFGVRLVDLLSGTRYERNGNDLLSHGLYLDMPAWGCHVFEVSGF